MRLRALWISLCLLLVCAGLAGLAIDGPSAGQAATSAGVKAFVGARLIDGSGKPAVENAALIARDGRVEAAGPASEVKTPAGAQTINLAGKFIIPGLISTHVHVSDVQGLRPPAYTEENTLRQLGVFARYGVTSVLSLGGEKEPAFKAREAQNTLVSTSADAASQVKTLAADMQRSLSMAGTSTAETITAGAREAQNTLVNAAGEAAAQVKTLSADGVD